MLTNKLEAVTFPTRLTLPEENIDPVNTKVSAFIEKLSPVPAKILVDPVTESPPDILVCPATFKTPLEYTKLAEAVAAFVVPFDNNTLP